MNRSEFPRRLVFTIVVSIRCGAGPTVRSPSASSPMEGKESKDNAKGGARFCRCGSAARGGVTRPVVVNLAKWLEMCLVPPAAGEGAGRVCRVVRRVEQVPGAGSGAGRLPQGFDRQAVHLPVEFPGHR